VRAITKADILLMVNQLADTRINKWRGNEGGSLYEAAGVLTHLRTCFRWALSENLVESDPTAGVRNPNDNKRERERVLSETEIRALWKVCDGIGYPYGQLIQLLILTGQRLREVAEMPWGELDLDPDNRVWHLPSERAKNGNAHDIHLSDLALEIIAKLPRFARAGKTSFVFSVTGAHAISTFSYHKRQIDQRLQAVLGKKVEPWTLHDLRRTCATGMAELGIAPHVLDRVLNHVSGTIKGVARIYNRSQYSIERKAALDAWGRHVEALVYPERAKTNVVEMRGR
jgi:integrase